MDTGVDVSWVALRCILGLGLVVGLRLWRWVCGCEIVYGYGFAAVVFLWLWVCGCGFVYVDGFAAVGLCCIAAVGLSLGLFMVMVAGYVDGGFVKLMVMVAGFKIDRMIFISRLNSIRSKCKTYILHPPIETSQVILFHTTK
jgi:hypothetical protein